MLGINLIMLFISASLLVTAKTIGGTICFGLGALGSLIGALYEVSKRK